MNQQPDKLFQERFKNYQRPVPSAAWSRIETRLDKKNNKALWLKIAASVIVLTSAGILLWPKKTIEIQPQVLSAKSENKVALPQKNENTTKEKSVVPVIQNDKKESSVKEKSVIKGERKQVQEQPANDIIIQEVIVAETEEEKIPVSSDISEQNIVTETIETSVVIQEAQSEPTGITLIYSSEEVNEKYLDKKALAEATSETKKPSTLRKLLEKAYDLKHNQDPFGDLRQKKNEILALNFKNEKQRSQNK